MMNYLLSFNSSAIFCLAIPANLLASSSLLQTKKTEPFSSILHTFKSSEILLSEKNLATGPLPIIFHYFFQMLYKLNHLLPQK